MKKVSFTETDAAVYEERVEFCFARSIRNGKSSAFREFISRTYDKRIKGKISIEEKKRRRGFLKSSIGEKRRFLSRNIGCDVFFIFFD